jgi:hypothetical protein
MTKTTTTLTITVFLLLALGLGTLGFFHRALRLERDGLLTTCATLEEKAAMLKKGYGEQKALAENAQRARQVAEAKAAKANQLLTEVKGEQAGETKELLGKVVALTQQLTSRGEAEKGAREQSQQAIAQWRAKVEELQGTNTTAQAKIKEQEARIAEVNALASSTKAALESEAQQHQGCRDKNMTLAGLAQDLATSYRKKGVVETLASNEPLTQLQKVKLEKLSQEYLDRIDQQTLPRTGAGRP